MASITSELFEFNKMIFIYIITILVSFFWLLKMIINKTIILKKSFLDIFIILFLISQILSTVFSIDRQTSLFGYYGRFNGGLLSIICYVVLYYGLISNFRKESILKLLKISLVSSLLVIFWGLPGRFGYDLSCFLFTNQLNNSCWTDQFHPETRMFSTLGQPNWLGAYLAIQFFIGLYFLFQKEKKSFPLYIYLFLNFSVILFTRSRSALVSVVFGLFSLSVILWFSLKQKKQLITLLIVLLIPILIFKTGINSFDKLITIPKLTSQKVPPQTKTTNTNSGYKIQISESFDIRKIVWQGAFELGKKYPLFGTGVETYAYAYYFVRPVAHNLTSEWDYLYNKAHNEFLNYLATTGFVGLGTYILMIAGVMFLLISNIKYQISNPQIKNQKEKNLKRYNNITIYLLFSYLSILITNFFGFSTTTVNLFFYLIPAFLIVYQSQSSNVAMKQCDNERTLTLSQKTTIVILLISTVYLLLSTFRYWLADVTYAQADMYSKMGDFQSSANLLNQALQLKYEHVYEDKLSYVLANLAVLASSQKKSDIANKLISIADIYNQKTIKASPKNVLYWKTRAKNYYLFYQTSLDKTKIDEGILALNEAQKLSPTDLKIPYSLSVFYSILYDDEKDVKKKEELKNQSIYQVNKAIQLKPDYRDSYFLKGQLYKKYGNKDEAKKTLQYILDNINSTDQEAKKELQSL